MPRGEGGEGSGQLSRLTRICGARSGSCVPAAAPEPFVAVIYSAN